MEQQQPCKIGKSYFPNQGWNLNLFLWKCSVLTTGPPGKSPCPSKERHCSHTFHSKDLESPSSSWGQRPDLSSCVCVLSGLCGVQLFVTLWTVAHKAPLSMGFSRQEYWGGLLCPPSGDLPDRGIEPMSLTSNQNWQASSLPLAPPGNPRSLLR